MNSFHIQYTRCIRGVHWTVTLSEAGFVAERGMLPHWHQFSDGTHFWHRHVHKFTGPIPTTRHAQRMAGRIFNRLRATRGLLFVDMER